MMQGEIFLAEKPAKLFEGPAHYLGYPSFGKAKSLPDFTQREPFVEVERNHGSLSLVQLADRRYELLSYLQPF